MKIRAEELCAERSALYLELTKAIRDLYLQKRAYEDATAKTKNRAELWAAFHAARTAQLKAQDAFNHHIKEHGCKR